ncbi:MAG: LysM peptidoglycan-binding domain-containing protein [Winogradskyella sp.]|uniref:glucosaminidase domain-containing protein n=1 Tax=Winogradskyella sp. TaxID=1883156 RepID=UPI001824525E|nr:glucosaminidase domain-containing protein [Winogradskyella sp.]MBT8246114.1 glucosaminidase domain-containing protein [Winogradskyella sp.]NNK23972.1 LysM peptidoglycan-binding domain-containing protein [Winogradskyella sp.]
MKIRFLIIIVLCFAMACGSKKGVVTKKEKSKTKTEEVVVKENSGSLLTKKPKTRTSVDTYIDTYAQIAMSEMRTSKIPASITLAQGILESGSGNGRLAKEANNHFGIKCHGWKGAKIYHDDDRSQECFRKYKQASKSYKDHSDFLVGRKRYAKLFKLKANDYKGWARGLRAAGYATDRKYPQKLISLIERYELYKYDAKVLGGKSKKSADSVEVITHTIVKGDTLYSLSTKYRVSVEEIKRKNKLTSNDLSIGQILKIN